jgi:hypothetical protein
MTTFTTAQINGFFQTIDGLPSTTASIPSNLATAYVDELNATPPTATVAQIQANLENFPVNPTPPPTNIATDLFYRTSVAQFVLREFQGAWGVVPTTGAGSQYDNWVNRIILNSSLTTGAMSQQLAGSAEFMTEYGVLSATQAASVGNINQMCANFGVPVGPGAMMNVGQPIWQVLQNFVESATVIAAMDGPIANFQNLLLAGQTPVGSILTLPGSPGATFTLTPGVDAFSTSTPHAVFNAFPVVATSGLLNNTLNVGDNLQDSVGDGTLNYTASDSSFSNPAYAVGVTLNGIKTLNFIGDMSKHDKGGGFQGSITGLTAVNDIGSTGGLELGGIGQGLVTPLAAVAISGYAPIGGIGTATPPMFEAFISALAGTSTTPLAMAITGPVGNLVGSSGKAGVGAAVLDVATDGSPGAAASPNAAYGEWDLTLNSNANLELSQGGWVKGGPNIASVGGVTTLKLSGAGSVFLGQDFAGDWQKLTTIDASGETGAVVITGASAGVGANTHGAGNAFGTALDPTWLLGSDAGLLDEGSGTFALTTFDLGAGLNVLDVSSATATELAALTTTPGAAVAADNVIIVSNAAATTSSTATFANISGFATLGVTGIGAGGAGTIDMKDLPASINEILYFTPAAGDITINDAVNNLTIDFHGNNGTLGLPGFAATINGLVVATATLNLDFGNATLASEDNTDGIGTTGYSTVDINAVGDGVAGHADKVNGVIELTSTVVAGHSAPLTVDIAGAQHFMVTGGVFDTLARTPAADVINVSDTGIVDLGTTDFATVSAAASAGLKVADNYFNSTITGSAAGDNTLKGGDGGSSAIGSPGNGNTITGGAATDTIITGLGDNTVNLGATHTGDSITIGSFHGGVMTDAGDGAHLGAWGQFKLGSTPIAGPGTSIFGNALNGGTSASETVISNFSVATGSTDTLNFQAGDWGNSGTNNIGGFNAGLMTLGLTQQVAAGDSVSPELVTTSGQAFTAGANLVEIGGVNKFADAAQLASTLQTSFDLKFLSFASLGSKANVHFLVAYTDGSNIHIADLDIYNTNTTFPPFVNHSNAPGAHDYASDLVQLTGVNSFTALNAHLGAFV